MNSQRIRNPLLLLLTAIIWGTAFVAQSVGMDYVEPFTFNCIRSFLGGIFLLICIPILNKLFPERTAQEKALSGAQRTAARRQLLIGGIACGVLLGIASSLQQFGIQQTTVGKAGFITAFYIIIVPILGLFFKKRCGPLVWVGVALALAGLYFLCITDGFSLQTGDLLVLLCSVFFSFHILVIDHYTQFTDGVKLSFIQFFVSGIVCCIGMLLSESPNWSAILSAWQPILYTGILSCGVAYTLQVVGQKGVNPTVASLILSLESVVSVLAGWLILHQALTGREILGCVFMFAAIILAQLPQKKKTPVPG